MQMQTHKQMFNPNPPFYWNNEPLKIRGYAEAIFVKPNTNQKKETENQRLSQTI